MFIHLIIDKNSKTLLFHPILSYLKNILKTLIQCYHLLSKLTFLDMLSLSLPKTKKYFPSGSIFTSLVYYYISPIIILYTRHYFILYYVLLNSDHHLKTNQEHSLLIDSRVYINIGINVQTKYMISQKNYSIMYVILSLFLDVSYCYSTIKNLN